MLGKRNCFFGEKRVRRRKEEKEKKEEKKKKRRRKKKQKKGEERRYGEERRKRRKKKQEERFFEPKIVDAPILLTNGKGRPKIIRDVMPGRQKKKKKKEFNMVPKKLEFAGLVTSDPLEPTLANALNGEHKKEWKAALKTEFDELSKVGVWVLTPRPQNTAIIGTRWLLRTKYNPDGTVERRKARLVAKGYTQQEGIDFKETYTPVARMQSVRTILAITAERKLSVFHLDVTIAYTYGKLEEDIYIYQPEEFFQEGKENHVYKLKRALYGLKQVDRQWNKALNQVFTQLGLEQSDVEKCLYTQMTEHGAFIVTVYVDNFIVATNNKTMFQKFKQNISKNFKIRDLGPQRTV